MKNAVIKTIFIFLSRNDMHIAGKFLFKFAASCTFAVVHYEKKLLSSVL